jgi:hypothetical protein
METINATAREQFVSDYCLVVDNDYESYKYITQNPLALAGNVSGLSDEMRNLFETYISQVVERESEAGHEVGSLLISQMLIGFGSAVFDDIARHYITLTKESQQ